MAARINDHPHMETLAVLWAPLVLVWGASSVISWLRTGRRRGVLRRRWRDLRGRGESIDDPCIVDVSRSAASRLVAVCVGSSLRGIAFVIMSATALLASPLPIPWPLTIAIVVGLQIGSHLATREVYRALTGASSAGYGYGGTTRYTGPGHSLVGLAGHQVVCSSVMSLGAICILGAGLVLALGRGDDDVWLSVLDVPALLSWLLAAASLLLGVAISVGAVRLERRLRRRTMRSVTRLSPRENADGPPVVFLRPFAADTLMVHAHAGPRRAIFGDLVPRRVEYLEDVATWMLWTVGSVVAVSDPRTPSNSTLGAAHHRLSPNEDWQTVIRDLLERAVAIVLIPGTTPSVAWEVATVLGTKHLAAKALFVNPNVSQQQAFLDAVGGGSPRQLGALRNAALHVIAATGSGADRTLICSPLHEDLDIESAVDWFLANCIDQAAERGVADSDERGSRVAIAGHTDPAQAAGPLGDVLISIDANVALELAAARRGDRPIGTFDILQAIVETDTRGGWETIQLRATFVSARDAALFRDPAAACEHAWRNIPLTAHASAALAIASRIAMTYDLRPMPPGILALGLVWDPRSGACAALLEEAEIDHGALLDLVQHEVLGIGLVELTRTIDRASRGQNRATEGAD